MADGEDAAPAARLRTVYSNYLKERLRDLRARLPFTLPPLVMENLSTAKDFAEAGGNLAPLESVEDLTGEDPCPYGNERCGYVYLTKQWGGYPSLATEAEPRDRPREEMTGGDITGEVLYPGNEHFIVEASCGTRYNCQSEVDKEKITSGTRVVVDMTTSTITCEEVDYIRDQMRRLRELVEIPLRHQGLLRSIGVKPAGQKSSDISCGKKSQEMILPPSCLERFSPVACPGSIAARNRHTERCPRATTVQTETVDCSGKDRKRIVGAAAFNGILFAPPEMNILPGVVYCKLS